MPQHKKTWEIETFFLCLNIPWKTIVTDLFDTAIAHELVSFYRNFFIYFLFEPILTVLKVHVVQSYYKCILAWDKLIDLEIGYDIRHAILQ